MLGIFKIKHSVIAVYICLILQRRIYAVFFSVKKNQSVPPLIDKNQILNFFFQILQRDLMSFFELYSKLKDILYQNIDEITGQINLG